MEIKRFKNSFAENIFRFKYAQGPNDTWDALADRLVEDVCGTRWGTTNKLLSDGDRQQLAQYIKEQKFIPGGRYLYYCFSPESKILKQDYTWEQAKNIVVGDVVVGFDEEIKNSKFKPAKVTFVTTQKTKRYKITTSYGSVVVSDEHSFVAKRKEKQKKRADSFCWIKAKDLLPGNWIAFSSSPWEVDTSFEGGWLSGIMDGEGTVSKGSISISQNPGPVLDKICRILSEKGIKFYVKGREKDKVHTVYIKGRWESVKCLGMFRPIRLLNNWYSKELGSFWSRIQPHAEVLSVEEVEEGDVVVIETSTSTLIGEGYLSHNCGREAKFFNNCYLLRAEFDNREEWSNVTWRAMSCLMTGGGIGIDYSALRASGRPLIRTGGKASGPLPLMFAINEIGRNVMQGGSRRSAIYASLNWKHEDTPLFLRAKNWADQPIVPGVTHWDAKNLNFNHHAPLDMTNISVNYDDEWLNPSAPYGGKAELDVIVRAENTVFLENCKQAMMTGEPGFSFNFGDKENETLRNAPLGPDTYVLTIDGYRQIRDIVDSVVKIWTGKQWANTTFRKTGESIPVVRVIMSGKREIIAEPSHEFFLEDGTKKAAKDLEKGDNLLIRLNNEVDSFLCSDYYSLGYIYGDGTFHRVYPRAEVTFCTSESRQCFDNFDKTLISSYVLSDSRGFLRAYTKNSELFRNRRKEIFPEDLLGSHSGTAQQCSFLAGLFDADGNYTEERGTVRVASKHLEFLQGVRRLLESLGILSGISTAGVSTYGQSQGYMLTVYSEYASRFGEIIPTKRLKVKPYESYRKTKIKVIGVEDAGISDVFCCDVGVDEHSFMAEGVIVSNCTEVTSEDDSDVCNLGSINLGNIESLEDFKSVVQLASRFLVCGTLRADLPYEKVYKVREKNRRLGLGLMGIHEWLLRRGYGYEVVPELHEWLKVYKSESEQSANEHCDRLFISRPVAYRAIAPTGTIGILAATTTGIEPLFAVAYKRRYLTDGTKWRYEYVVDSTADRLITDYAIDPDTIETAYKLSHDFEKRIKFQADVQDYVDMSISSTINLPAWGTKNNNEDKVEQFSKVLAAYAPRLRGFTCYPDSSRGGQPITEVPYSDAVSQKGVIFEEHEEACKGGICGI